MSTAHMHASLQPQIVHGRTEFSGAETTGSTRKHFRQDSSGTTLFGPIANSSRRNQQS